MWEEEESVLFFLFVLHTGLEDPTTAESERSLQKQKEQELAHGKTWNQAYYCMVPVKEKLTKTNK